MTQALSFGDEMTAYIKLHSSACFDRDLDALTGGTVRDFSCALPL
jgi:hypothetical protein